MVLRILRIRVRYLKVCDGPGFSGREKWESKRFKNEAGFRLKMIEGLGFIDEVRDLWFMSYRGGYLVRAIAEGLKDKLPALRLKTEFSKTGPKNEGLDAIVSSQMPNGLRGRIAYEPHHTPPRIVAEFSCLPDPAVADHYFMMKDMVYLGLHGWPDYIFLLLSRTNKSTGTRF